MKKIFTLFLLLLLAQFSFAGAVTSTNDLKLALLPTPSLKMELKDLSPCLVAADFEVPKTGFYLLEFRKAGWFSWGPKELPHSVGLWLDGAHRFSPWSIKGKAGPSDVLSTSIWLTKGTHHLEFRGSRARRFLTRQYGPRVWWRIPDEKKELDKTFELTQEPEGESIFRLGTKISWRVRRSTLDWKDAREITLSVVRQRTTNEVFRKSVKLPAGKVCAEALFPFPSNLEGVFDYSFTDDKGNVLSGPWEFVVIDPRPRKLPKKWKNLPPVPEAKDFGILVDSIDFSTEPTGSVHRIRDNATSTIVRAGKIGYRRSGTYRNYSFWWDLDGKNGGPFRLPREKSWWKDFGTKPEPKCYYMDADWFGFTLKVRNVQVPHLAVFYVPNDVFRRFPIELIDTQTGRANGAAIEVAPCVGEPGTVKVSIPFWPNANKIDALMMPSNTHGDERQTEAALAKVELYECPDGFPPLKEASGAWQKERCVGWRGEQGNLSPEVCSIPPVWQDPNKKLPHVGVNLIANYDYTSFVTAWERCGEYNAYLGCNWMSWPIHSYFRMAHVRTSRLAWGYPLFGSVPKDRYCRETIKLILLICEKYGVSLYGDTMVSMNVPKMMKRTKKSFESFTSGYFTEESELVQTMMLTEGVKDYRQLEGAFLDENSYGGNLNPVHPIARRFLIKLYGEIAAVAKDYPAFKGITLRQWKECSSSLSATWGSQTSGYDDFTLGVYAKETGNEIPPKSASYRQRVSFFRTNEVQRGKWFKWRTDKATELQKDILAEIRRVRPDLKLQMHYHHTTAAGPDASHGMFSDESVASDIIVQGGRQGNECNRLDPNTFKYFDERKGVGSLDDPLRFKKYWWIYPSGLNIAQATLAEPNTTMDFARALVEGPFNVAEIGMLWSYPGSHQLMREWARAFRAIPKGEYRQIETHSPEYKLLSSGKISYAVSLCPYPIKVKLSSKVEDLVDGGKKDTFALKPYGLAVMKGRALPKESYRKAKASVRLRNPYGKSAAKGVLATFELGDVLRRGGKASEFKIVNRGREIPLQIDAVDNQGNYTTNFLGRVASPKDEVAFLVDFAEGEDEKVLELHLKGSPRKEYKNPISVSNRVVRTGMVEIGIGSRGVNGFYVAGKRVFSGCGVVTGAVRRVEILSYPYGYRRPDKKPYSSSPCVVYSSGPVRFLAGYGYGEARTVRDDPYKSGFEVDVFTKQTEHRVWQVVADSDTLDIISRIRYDKAIRLSKKLYNWVEPYWCDPATPMEAKRVYSLHGGLFVCNDFVLDKNPNPKAALKGSFLPGYPSDVIGYYDARVGASLMYGVGASHSAQGGFKFSRGLGITQYEPLVPKRGGFDFRMAIRGLNGDIDEGAFRREMKTLIRPEVKAIVE